MFLTQLQYPYPFMDQIVASPIKAIYTLLLPVPIASLVALITLTCTYHFSTLRSHLILQQYHNHTASPCDSQASTVALTPLPLPSMPPWVGHTSGFLTAFIPSILNALVANFSGACCVCFGGRHSHLLFLPVSAAALTQNHALDRHGVWRDI